MGSYRSVTQPTAGVLTRHLAGGGRRRPALRAVGSRAFPSGTGGQQAHCAAAGTQTRKVGNRLAISRMTTRIIVGRSITARRGMASESGTGPTAAIGLIGRSIMAAMTTEIRRSTRGSLAIAATTHRRAALY